MLIVGVIFYVKILCRKMWRLFKLWNVLEFKVKVKYELGKENSIVLVLLKLFLIKVIKVIKIKDISSMEET